MRLLAFAILVAFIAAGCGQKGPLTLKTPPDAEAAPPQPDREDDEPEPRRRVR